MYTGYSQPENRCLRCAKRVRNLQANSSKGPLRRGLRAMVRRKPRQPWPCAGRTA